MGLCALGMQLSAVTLPAQDAVAQEMPDVAELEASTEAVWAAALEMDDAEPMWVMSAWGAVVQSEVILDRVKALAAGVDPPPTEATLQRVLDRWRRLRPDDAAPHLFPALQIDDPAERSRRVLEVYARFPGDALALSQAVESLQRAGDETRAEAILDDYIERHPERPIGYGLLARHHARQKNESRHAEVLRRWAAVTPADPDLVARWLDSPLREQDPIATERLLHDFFSAPPSDRALDVCRRLARDADPGRREAARTCLERIAAEPETTPASGQAASALVQMAAADGDSAGLQAELDDLSPEARADAALAAAHRLEVPARCEERIELLRATWVAHGSPTRPDDELPGRISSALSGCSERPAAQELFLELVRAAPTEGVFRVIGGWARKVNETWRGELPAEAVAPLLERRLAAEPDAEPLLEALDVVYQLGAMEEKRFRLLRDWQRRKPVSFRHERTMALADALAARGDLEEAAGLLEAQIENQFHPALVDALWGILIYSETMAARADALTERLLASAEPLRTATGHLLAARSAALREDLAAAEEHYRASLAGEGYREDAAVELLTLLDWQGHTDRLAETARQICQRRTADDELAVARCATSLLSRAGRGEQASDLLPERLRVLPDSVRELEELAGTARSAERFELAEQALRRIVEIDPMNAQGWGSLAVFLEQRGSHRDLEALLADARQALTTPPETVLRAVARSRLSSHRPREAIDLLREARALRPPRSDPAWIDAEIRKAYVSLAGTVPTRLTARAPAGAEASADPPPEPEPAASPHDLLIRAEALHAGTGGRHDPAAARELFERAAAGGDAVSSCRLALILQLDRTGEIRDPDRAPDLYRQARRTVEALAAEGDSYAQYLVGTAALSGVGGVPDHRQARLWLERAAADGVAWAWHNLGWMQWTGRGFDEDERRHAVDSYRRAAELDNVVSMLEVARLTLVEHGEEGPCVEGRRWLERSAGTGSTASAAYLGKVLLYGIERCVRPEPSAARPWLEAAAAAGEAGAAYDLGLALWTAAGEHRDPGRALALLERAAADEADPLAFETLAWLYATGAGVGRDPARARELLADAARVGSDGFVRLAGQARRFPIVAGLYSAGVARLEALAGEGDRAAASWLAIILYDGVGVAADAERAVRLARVAAAAGETAAVRLLAAAHRNGRGAPRDDIEALRLYRRCAHAGDSFCMMFYGHALLEGTTVEQDLAEGLVWLTRSAEAGNWWAIGDLGRLYDEGWHGLPRDEVQAAQWRRVAARQGSAEARGWLLYHGHSVD